MFHNSTNINKANNHLSNEIIEHKKYHDVKHPGPGFEQAQKCIGVNPINVISSLPLLVSRFPNSDNIDINKR